MAVLEHYEKTHVDQRRLQVTQHIFDMKIYGWNLLKTNLIFRLKVGCWSCQQKTGSITDLFSSLV